MTGTESLFRRVEILTPYHLISGDLTLVDQRFSDYLNDRQRESTIALHHATIARLIDPGTVIERHSTAVVFKPWVVATYELFPAPVTLSKRLYSYVKKEPHQVFVAMDGMEVHGNLHGTHDFDLKRLVVTATEDYLPLTNAAVRLYVNPDYDCRHDAVMVNIRRIRYIARVEKGQEAESVQREA
jgi:hypothetical protein